MGLRETQRDVAKLATDSGARGRRRPNPRRGGGGNDRGGNERTTAGSGADYLPAEQIGRFARSLAHKKSSDQAKFFPLAKRVLGVAFNSEMDKFIEEAKEKLPEDLRKQAIVCGKFLLARQQGNTSTAKLAREVIGYELARTEAGLAEPCFKIRFFRHAVQRLDPTGDVRAQMQTLKRLTVIVWVRFSAKSALKRYLFGRSG